MTKKSLYPAQKEVKVDVLTMILMAIFFALFFFVIGIMTMHYPKIMSVI